MTEPIVVVGGGLAGGTLIVELRNLGFDGPITAVCGEPHPPYERPPLSKSYLRGESPADDTYLKPAAWYADNSVDLRTGVDVRAIDLAGRRLATSDGDVAYGRLVLATGCRARTLAVESTDTVAVHYLRTLADATVLKAALVDGARLLVVGGGWIGLEVAASAQARGVNVTLVEPTEQPLAMTLGPEVGSWFAELHRAHGVDLRTGVGLSGVEGHDAVLDDTTRLEVDLVVIGIGAIPNDDLARDAGLAVDNGVHVDASLVSSDPNVLAIGDVAAHQHPIVGQRIRVEHWQNAQSQGKAAARILLGEERVYDELPSFFSDQWDAGLEYFGYTGKGPTDVTVEGTDDGFVAWWHRGGRLVAAGHVNQWDRSGELKQQVADAF